MSEAAIKDAMDAAHQFLSDTAQRRAYVNRLMAVLDYNSGMENARAEGEAKGRMEAQKDTAVRLLQRGMTPGQTAEITQLPLTEVLKLQKT